MNLFIKPLLLSIIILGGASFLSAQSHWKLLYHNDENGNTVEGSLEELMDAVREGEEVRISWWSRRVLHLAEAKFLTIMTDSTVHAQIDPILGQSPDFDNHTITLKENMEWTMSASTTGSSDALTRNVITGEIVGHVRRPRAIRWFIIR